MLQFHHHKDNFVYSLLLDEFLRICNISGGFCGIFLFEGAVLTLFIFKCTLIQFAFRIWSDNEPIQGTHKTTPPPMAPLCPGALIHKALFFLIVFFLNSLHGFLCESALQTPGDKTCFEETVIIPVVNVVQAICTFLFSLDSLYGHWILSVLVHFPFLYIFMQIPAANINVNLSRDVDSSVILQ